MYEQPQRQNEMCNHDKDDMGWDSKGKHHSDSTMTLDYSELQVLQSSEDEFF